MSWLHNTSNISYSYSSWGVYSLAKHFMYPEQREMSIRDALNLIRPEHVAFGAGAASLLSHLALSLAEKGDAVLIPAPVSEVIDLMIDPFINCLF